MDMRRTTPLPSAMITIYGRGLVHDDLVVLGFGGNAYYVPFEWEGMLTLYIRATIWELISFFSLQPISLTLEELTMESVPHMDEEVSVYR
jgi:hypothetical protein